MGSKVNMAFRFEICGLVCLFLLAIVALQLFYLQTFRYYDLSKRVDKASTSVIGEVVLRGSIVDRNGKTIAESLPKYECWISKPDIKKGDTEKIQKIIASNTEYSVRDLQKLWRSSGRHFKLKRALTLNEYETIAKELKAAKIAGLRFDISHERVYPSGGLALDILGQVSPDSGGTGGIEKIYNDALVSVTQKIKVLRDKKGRTIKRLSGKNETGRQITIYLTIDEQLQFFAEELLDKTVKDTRAKGGMIIVQNPNTGEILASASAPRISGKSPMLQSTYDCGSVMKTVTFAAAVEEKLLDLNEEIDCHVHGKWRVRKGVVLNDDKKEGVLTISEILQYSSNIGTGKVALRLGKTKFYEYLQAFGFGTKTGIGFPGETAGLLSDLTRWDDLTLIVASYGHGITTTGLQVANAYSAIANGGTLYDPYLIKKIVASDGEIVEEHKPVKLRTVISPSTVNTIKKLLVDTVDTGTGNEARIAGYSVAGKTGTSKKLIDGIYSNTHFIASFAGFVPAGNPQYVIIVTIDEPQTSKYGGTVAGPVFKEMASYLLAYSAVAPDRPDTLGKPLPVLPKRVVRKNFRDGTPAPSALNPEL